MTLPKHEMSGVTPNRSGGAAAAQAEAGDDLIEDQQCARFVAGDTQALQESGHGRHQAHIRCHRLDPRPQQPARRAQGTTL